MKILQYFAQRRINKALMKALATEVTAKLDDRKFNLNSDLDGIASYTVSAPSADVFAEALSNGMKSLAKSDNAEGHDDNAQYVQLKLDGSPLADTASFGRPLSNAEVKARLDVTTSRITPEHPYVEFDETMAIRLETAHTLLNNGLDRSHVTSVLHTEDVLYIMELLTEVKKRLEA